MAYGVISDINWPSGAEWTGTVSIVENPPAEYHGSTSGPHYYDVTHWPTLEEARNNFSQVKMGYAGHSGIKFRPL